MEQYDLPIWRTFEVRTEVGTWKSLARFHQEIATQSFWTPSSSSQKGVLLNGKSLQSILIHLEEYFFSGKKKSSIKMEEKIVLRALYQKKKSSVQVEEKIVLTDGRKNLPWKKKSSTII